MISPAAPESVLVCTPIPIETYLADCRERVVDELRRRVPADGRDTGGLYALVLDYPLRAAKALRPGLCIATARMLGAPLDAALPTAAALELYHNAFLVHDDVEDASELRRGGPTLLAQYGAPIAVNVGDAMLALALEPLIANTEHLGVRRANAILAELMAMSRQSAEGQAVELGWIARRDWSIAEHAWLRMVYAKTARYSFVTPIRCGAMVAGHLDPIRDLDRTAALIGIAFQIQDDVLNIATTERYGKETAGDLWEGKHTLLLIHAVRRASIEDRAHAAAVLARPRRERTQAEVDWLLGLLQAQDSLGYARDVALRHAARATVAWGRVRRTIPASVHREFIDGVLDYVTTRQW